MFFRKKVKKELVHLEQNSQEVLSEETFKELISEYHKKFGNLTRNPNQ